MRRSASLCVLLACAAALAVGIRNRPARPRAPRAASAAEVLAAEGARATLAGARSPASGSVRPEPPATAAGAPDRVPAPPRSPGELRAFVAWMRSLPEDELLRLSNAEYGFREGELVRLLRGLEGDWVVPALGELAVGEPDALVRATLVEGLCGGASLARLDDPRLLVPVERLAALFSAREADPYDVARTVAMDAFAACLRQKQDLALLLGPHLAASDNPGFLVTGYDLIGNLPGGEQLLRDQVSAHPSAEGRMGALEGLRNAATHGRVPADELTRLGLDALSGEGNARNRLLLVEMIGAAGGESGLAALEDLVRAGGGETAAQAAATLALRADPARALAAVDGALADPTLGPGGRTSLYAALGAIPGEEPGRRLLAVANDAAAPDEERLAGLRGLWSRPVDDATRAELEQIVAGDAPGALRAESLRMLAFGADGAAVDARARATEDRDPIVRREAVVLAALGGGGDARGWLEERLLEDDAPEVQAAALGALVMRAHYGGGDAEGAEVLNHLARARGRTDDPGLLRQIARAEELVRDDDPRHLGIELRGEAELYGKLSGLVRGPAQLEMRRREELARRMIAALGRQD